ncbi:MAG: META domain-containing protein [Hyphomonadaceae bacterium]
MRALIAAALFALCAGAAAALPAGLLGRTWTPIRQDHGLDPPSQRPTIVFNEEGASGRTACNQWQARFAGIAPHIRFTDFRVTEVSCPPPLQRIEQTFLEGLRRMDGMRPEGGSLVLIDAAGREIMRLAPE